LDLAAGDIDFTWGGCGDEALLVCSWRTDYNHGGSTAPHMADTPEDDNKNSENQLIQYMTYLVNPTSIVHG
jgi:hypothetical protein